MKEMLYSEFVQLYEDISKTSKRLEKVAILSSFLKNFKTKGKSEWLYLLNGKVVPDYDTREFGISTQLVVKAISSSTGEKSDNIVQRYNKIGDLSEIAKELSIKKKQGALFKTDLTVSKVFDNLRKILDVSGKGAVERKISLTGELFAGASPDESKYIIRTLLGDLRIGMADGVIKDSLIEAFFLENKELMKPKIEEASDLVNDISLIYSASMKGEKEIEKIGIVPGVPIKVMLPVKVENMKDAFEICGETVALEHKYDGFRMLINKYGNEVKLFTRKLENVTSQFPDVVKHVREYIKEDSFVLDAEVVGFNPKTKKYMPFESISQRIKRKYDIDKLIAELPVEINIFDIIYLNGESMLNLPFRERREVIEKIVKTKDKVIRCSFQLITDDEKVAEKFYKDALKEGEEGVMIKNLDAPYKQGRRVGYIVKLKPMAADLDLVITGAEYGTGKRAGWLTSFIVSCREKDKFFEVGMVSSGLKEKAEEGTSYDEMTNILKPLIMSGDKTRVKIKPKVVVSVTYQNIQESPSYTSGYALRFPTITHYRPDRNTADIATLEDIKREAKKQKR